MYEMSELYDDCKAQIERIYFRGIQNEREEIVEARWIMVSDNKRFKDKEREKYR